MIEKMKKRVSPAVSVTIFALLLVCGTIEATANAVQVGQETPGDAANTLPYDVSDIAETVITPGLLADTDPIVTALKNGDTETLVGMVFGEPFDYELFEKAGWGYIDGADITFYHRKDRDEDLTYLFEGEGHRFNSLQTSSWEGRFFCLELGKDTRETVKDLFGNPDETGMANCSWSTIMTRGHRNTALCCICGRTIGWTIRKGKARTRMPSTVERAPWRTRSGREA